MLDHPARLRAVRDGLKAKKVEALLLADCLREVKKHGGRVQKQQD
jgi:hypothetical protein